MKEGQTQEPVGGMKTAKEIVQKHKSIEYRNARNRFLGGYSFEYLNIHSAELAVEEYHNQFTQPIKTEREDEEVKRIKNWIEQRMSLFPDDPNLSERGAYDGYLNVLNIINNKTTAPPSPELREEAQDLLIKIAPPETFGEDADCERIYNIIDELAKAASLPQSSTEEEKELWEEVANVLYGFEMGRRFDMNELLSTYKITKR